MVEKILEYLSANGFKISTIFFAALFFAALANTENIMIWKSWLYGLASKSFVFAKKKQISNKVRGTILKSLKNQDVGMDILPSDLKVVWINNENPETFIENNQVIVRFKQSSNPNENLVTAVSEYINNGLLYNVKRYLNKDVINASRVLMVRNIIKMANRTTLTYLDENYILPRLNRDEELKELLSDLEKIDNNGMFIGILLNEFYKAGMTISGEIEDPELIAESKEFMRFLYNIAIRISKEPRDLCFDRDYFKVAIFLTASDKTLRFNGIRPFVKAATQQLANGIETIYIFGLGRKQEVAKQISEELDDDFRISEIVKHPYKHINTSGKRIQGVFYECTIHREFLNKD